MTEYIVVDKKEFEFLKNQEELSKYEAEIILENQDVFIKFLRKAKLNFQIALSLGDFRGKEELLYRSMETVDELINSIKSIEKGFIEHNKKKEE